MRRDNINYTNVLDTLQQQHVEIDMLLDDLVAAGVAGAKPFANVKVLLRQHMEAEENQFYPKVSALSGAGATAVATATTQHTAIKNALTALEGSFTAPNITTLKTAVDTHVAFERDDVFTIAREGFNSSQSHELAMSIGDSVGTSQVR
jgi:hypothetical protein